MDAVSTAPPPADANNFGENDQQRHYKKPKLSSINHSEPEFKRVAEIVLVLSTMSAMRGGNKPTDLEVQLMTEARNKLAILCQEIAPKDIVAGDAIGTVFEDLGFNAKVFDQRLGFRTPKASICERYSFTLAKMEEAKKFAAASTTYTSQLLQTNTSGMVEKSVPTNAVRTFLSDKSNHETISSTVSMASIPPNRAAGSSVALQYQSTSNEVRAPMISGVMSSSHMGRIPSSVAIPRVENPQFKVTGGTSKAPYVLQVQANSLANQSLVNAPMWSIQTQPVSLDRSVSENKVPIHNSGKGEGTADATVSRAGLQVATNQSIRPFITQTGPGNMSSMHQPFQGGNMVQPPSIPSHSDIAKVVQKLLLPMLPVHPTWTPPSRDYMNKAFTCQMCELTVSEVDSVLLCDACEKGYHLKCLQPSVIRGIHNSVDWHCTRCLNLSSGQPLPPKYGRVMRSSITSPSFPSNTAGIQQSSEKKPENLDPKVSPQMLATNGNSVPIVSSASHKTEQSFDSNANAPDTRDIQVSNISSSIETIDEKPDPNISMKSAACSASTGLQGESYAEQIDSKALRCRDTSESETLPKPSEPAKYEILQSSQDFQVEMTVSQDNAEISSDRHISSSSIIRNQEESHGGENITYDIKHDDLDVAQPNTFEGFGGNTEGIQHSPLSSDSSHAVEWIGDVVQHVDEKKFYQSCCIDGVTYSLQGYAFFTSSHGKLTPSKLQSMWEDSKTGIKWVKATKCYFPDDLPGNIGHPCVSEVNEVYESNSDRIEIASSIRGPCVVLPYDKFKQENDRKCQLGIEASASVQPIFLCRWFYDEIKKSFQPVIS